MSNYYAALIIFFGFLIFLLFLKPFYLPGRGARLFRTLLPTWRFFEDFGEVPLLFCRFRYLNENFQEWHLCLSKPQTKWHHIFLNPQGNHYLACHSLLAQLLEELNDFDEKTLSEFNLTTSFLLTRNLVHHQIKNLHRDKDIFEFQFKICTVHPNTPQLKTEDVLISPVYEF